MKTIIHCWGHKEGSGIGDQIRGSYGLYLISKELGYNFIIDISLWTPSQFLVPKKHDYIIDPNKLKFYANPAKETLIKIIKESPSHYCYLSTNCCLWAYSKPMEEEFKIIMKELLTPKPELSQLIEKEKSRLGIYSCLHLRLGDDHFKGNGSIFKYYHLFRKHYRENDLLVSDSEKLRNFVKKNNIKMLDIKPSHLGSSNDSEGSKNTLLEFFLISKATSIRTYSAYHWVSGFVNSISKIYDIPLSSLKN